MSKVEITFLGTTAGIPTQQRSHPAIHLSYRSDKEFRYLFDCGEGTQRQILFAHLKLMKINEVFITHWHGDHYFGVPGLVDTMSFENRTEPLVIYSTEPERVKGLLDTGYNPPSFEIVCKSVPVEGDAITTVLETDDFAIVSTPVKHPVPSVAYALIEKDSVNIDRRKLQEMELPLEAAVYGELKKRGAAIFKGRTVTLKDVGMLQKGKKIVYSGDTQLCDNLVKIAHNADLLIQDCTYFDGGNFQEYGHASIKDVIKLVEMARVKRAILTHISRRYKDPENLKKELKDYPDLEIAKDFMKVII